jgi:hypothetical protein
MGLFDTLDWRQFIDDYPGMRLWPQIGTELGLKGRFAFRAQRPAMPEVTDVYELSLLVPSAFPRDIPQVKETAGRIPADGKHHRNSDGTLCLGSPLRLLVNISKNPTLIGFAENCLIPYLYAMSRNLNEGIPFVFGELEHGTPGELSDYAALLGVKNPDQARKAVRLLGMKERCANKQPCPCGCGHRLGRCTFRARLSQIRDLAPLSWFRSVAQR